MIPAPNYFEYYDIKPQFLINTAELKGKYLQKSRLFHPDFYTQASTQQQENALQQATFNNTAYKTLANTQLRTRYILELYAVLTPNENYALPPDFLMEMLDINEILDDLQHNYNANDFLSLQHSLHSAEQAVEQDFVIWAKNADNNGFTNEILQNIKKSFYKKQYLFRIKEKMLTFAHQP